MIRSAIKTFVKDVPLGLTPINKKKKGVSFVQNDGLHAGYIFDCIHMHGEELMVFLENKGFQTTFDDFAETVFGESELVPLKKGSGWVKVTYLDMYGILFVELEIVDEGVDF